MTKKKYANKKRRSLRTDMTTIELILIESQPFVNLSPHDRSGIMQSLRKAKKLIKKTGNHKIRSL